VAAPRAVVVIGPESTGKSALAERLARAYGAPLSDEYARAYAEATSRPLGIGDVDAIGRGQRDGEDAARAAAAARGSPLVVHDTDLVSTVVYSRHYFGDCPAWIPPAARARRADLYLLCLPDVPWVDDPVRGPAEAREAQLADFRAALDALGSRVVALGGAWAERDAAAHAAVDALLAGR
jgi:NadR type nicotinamide-nucleotide adenylyltransferase